MADYPEVPPHQEQNCPSWCVCNCCVEMENPQEEKCCGLKKCITSYQLFEDLCLDRNVLEVAIKARCDIRAEDLDFGMNSFRKAAYRQYILWQYGRLGKGNRRVCPSCVVKMIRIGYPSLDGNYMGFKPYKGLVECGLSFLYLVYILYNVFLICIHYII